LAFATVNDTPGCASSFSVHSPSGNQTACMTTKPRLETVKLLAQLVGGVLLACVVLLVATAAWMI
jgi:hypothetical protein